MDEKELLEKAKKMELDEWQMVQVRLGLKLLPVTSIESYMRKELSHRQMEQMRIALMDGIPLEDVIQMMNPEIDFQEMQRRRIAYQLLNLSEITQSLTEIRGFCDRTRQDEETISQLKEKIKEKDTSLQQLQHELEECSKRNFVHDEQVTNESVSVETSVMEKNKPFWFGRKRSKDKSIQELIKKNDYTANQLEEIRLSLEDGLLEDQLLFISRQKDAAKMKQLRLFYKQINNKDNDAPKQQAKENPDETINAEDPFLFNIDEEIIPEASLL